jgi:hypothetical protein
MDQELGMRVGSSIRLIRVSGNVRLGLSSLWPVPNSTNDPTGRAAKEALGMYTTVRSSSLQVGEVGE